MEYQKIAETTSDLIGNKIANKITKVSRSSPQNNSETIANEHVKEIPKTNICLQEKYIKLLMM